MNWRQDDIFAKKKFRHIFLINREKNNIKIKKTLGRAIGPNGVRGWWWAPDSEGPGFSFFFISWVNCRPNLLEVHSWR